MGGKRTKIPAWERIYLCAGLFLDDMGTGIGQARGHGEGNIIFEGSIKFFQKVFNISRVSGPVPSQEGLDQ